MRMKGTTSVRRCIIVYKGVLELTLAYAPLCPPYIAEPRKKMLQDLENLPSPTDYAKASGPKSCMKENGPPLYNHRNPGRSDIPVQFYHSVFDTFLRRLNGIDGEVDEE